MTFRTKGGRGRLPFTHILRMGTRLAVLAGLGLMLVCSSAHGGQFNGRRFQRPRFLQRAAQPRGNNKPQRPRAPQDEAALILLRKMLRPTEEYAGEQVTEVTAQGGRISRQHIKGDRRGRTRLDYYAPGDQENDIMLLAPEQYRYYHSHANVLDIALWPTERNEREKRWMALIRQGLVSVTRVGEETIAGRSASIILLAGENPQGAGRQVKFWIDNETGIQLKNEISNAQGLISRSYITSIVIGPEANVTAKDFEPQFPPTVRPNPLFPPASQFRNLQEARERLPFAPLEPANLPPGFHLTGVWVFGPINRVAQGVGSVLLRYEDDALSKFTLFERRTRNNLNGKPSPGPLRAARRSVQKWLVPAADGGGIEVLYLGHLAPEQAQAIHDSLR